MLAIADQALRLLDHRIAAPVVRTAADRLADQRQPALALEVISHGLASLPVEFCLELYPAGAFLLTRQGRHAEAIDLLLAGHRAAGHDVLNSDQLLEQAAFLAFGKRDLARLAEIKAAMIDHGCDRKLSVLCEVLEHQVRGRYKAAATLAGSHRDYYPIAAQGAFCWLAEAQRDRAAKILETVRFRRSRASSWLEGVLAGSYREWEVYGQAMSDASTRQLTETDSQARDLWVRVWEEDTRSWTGTYPAFCFPRLPAGLTGLPVDIEYRASGVSVTAEHPDHDFSLDAIGNVSHHAWHGRSETTSEAAGHPAPPGSTFNVYGNVAVGQHASVHRNYVCGIKLPVGTTREDLIADLEVLLSDVSRTMDAGEAEPTAAGIREAIAAAGQDDQPRLTAGLKAAGKWALDRATEIGTAVAVAALQHALGISQ